MSNSNYRNFVDSHIRRFMLMSVLACQNMGYTRTLINISWTTVVRTIVVLILGLLISYFYRKWQRFKSVVDNIPAFKLKWYHFLGHAQFALYVRLFHKLPLSVHIYDFLGLTGTGFVYQKEGIANIWAINYPVVLVYKPNTVEAILNHSTQLEKAWMYKFTYPWLGRGLLTSSGTKWKHRRKLLTPAFHFNILQDFLPVLNAKAKILAHVLKQHIGDEFVNIVPFVTRCSLDVLCDSVLGVDLHVQTKSSVPYVQSVNFLTSTISERMFNTILWPDLIFRLSPTGRKFKKHVQLVQDFTLGLIKEKKAKLLSKGRVETDSSTGEENIVYRKKRALMDLLLDEHVNNNSMSEKDIVEEVDTFTFEGHDTTAMGMSFALYLIGLHPGHQEKIHQELDSIFGDEDRDATVEDLKEMKYLESVIKETLRLFPPVPLFGRFLTDDIEIDGRTIPKGSMCMVYPYMLHRDPESFPNPEKFEPDRFTLENSSGRHPFAYVPFSAGPRNCIGQRFALMEEKVVLSTILRRYKIRSLDPRDTVHLMNELVLRPVGGLRLEVRPRNYVPEKTPLYYHYP